MATIRNRNGTWQVQVRRNGHAPRSKSFLSKRDALNLATQTEAEMDATVFAVDLRVLGRTTMRDLQTRYRSEVAPAPAEPDSPRGIPSRAWDDSPWRAAGGSSWEQRSHCGRTAGRTICDGGARSEAARIGGVGLQIVRDWIARFDAEGLVDRKAPGKTPLLTDDQRAALARTVEDGPKPYLDGVVRWRLVDLVQWVWDEFGVPVSRQTPGRELRALGFRKLSARPRHHGQDPDALEAFKKTSPSGWRRSARGSRPGPSSSSGGRRSP